MKLRKLRIAWSVFWGLACVLVIVLWVRSYWWADNLSVPTGTNWTLYCASIEGRTVAQIYPNTITVNSLGWLPTGASRFTFSTANHPDDPKPFVQLRTSNGRLMLVAPHALVLLVFAGMATIIWLPWRFRLRTLLIATTLVAVVLGMAVYVSTK